MLDSDVKVARIFLNSENYKGLQAFFEESWQESTKKIDQPYRYRVYFTQKSFNLNEMFFSFAIENKATDEAEKERLMQIRSNTFLTQLSMLTKAKELADSFAKSGSFPRIRVIDELLITGRDLAEFYYRLENAILKHVAEHIVLRSSLDYRTIRSALLDSMDISIYMQNDKLALLDYDLLRKCTVKRHAGPSDWRLLVQSVTDTLTYSSFVENTSITPSFHLSADDFVKLSVSLRSQNNHNSFWHRKRWKYHCRNTVVWQKSLYGVDNTVVAQAVIRVSYQRELNRYTLTPYLFFLVPEDEALQQLYQAFGDYFAASGLTKLCRLMTDFSPALTQLRCNLLFSLSSTLVFFYFLHSAQHEDAALSDYPLFQSDIDKVAQCFATENEILHEFNVLLGLNDAGAALREKLHRKLFDFLLTHAEPLSAHARQDPAHGNDQYLRATEDYFFHIDMTRQEDIFFRQRNKVNYRASTAFYDPDSFLRSFLSSFPEDYVSLENKFGALSVMLQWGNVGLSTYHYDQSNTLYLKAGEGSANAGIGHYYRFLPALIALEEICDQEQLTMVRWATRYGRYLDKEENTQNLSALFPYLVSKVYRAGAKLSEWKNLGIFWLDLPEPDNQVRSIQEWTGEPWPEEEISEICSMTRTQYLNWEAKKQQHYINEVYRFFGRA